jgi:vancomycin resistance protein VanJ
MPNTPTAKPAAQRLLRHAPAAMIGLSASLCLALSICYALRPDACAAVTLWPPWLWLVPGLAILLLGCRRRHRRAALCAAALWLAYLLIFCEEPRTMLRFGGLSDAEFAQARRRGEALRIISLNCAGGSAEAAAEVEPYDPDIVLLQESPSESDVRALAERLFGDHASIVSEFDAAIIARGYLTPSPRDLPRHVAGARLRSPTGFEAGIFSLRLHPPILRADLWSPSAWRAQRANRQMRREQMERIAREIEALPEDRPIILGGDFNAPAGDAVFRVLRPRLHDASREGGRGWGNTVLNELPVLRFDQVWLSARLRAARVHSHRTQHSDHRMVVCDLLITHAPAPLQDGKD